MSKDNRRLSGTYPQIPGAKTVRACKTYNGGFTPVVLYLTSYHSKNKGGNSPPQWGRCTTKPRGLGPRSSSGVEWGRPQHWGQQGCDPHVVWRCCVLDETSVGSDLNLPQLLPPVMLHSLHFFSVHRKLPPCLEILSVHWGFSAYCWGSNVQSELARWHTM